MSTAPLSSIVDALLLDLDGTVWSGQRAIPGAVDAISGSGLTAMFITNNASRGSGEVASLLRGIGLDVRPEQVVTSAQAAVALASQHAAAGDPVLVVGAESFAQLASESGFRVVSSADERPTVVLHGHNPSTGWRELSEAALAIRAGARYIASNVDTTLPSPRGLLVGNGSMVAAVTSATGVVPDVAGKPGPAMFVQAAERAGATRPLAVGDRLDTDIAGAVASDVPSLHVLTGVSGPWDLVAAPPALRPTYVAESLLEIGQPAERLAPGAQGGFTATARGHDISLGGGAEDATPIDALRTVLEVAWRGDGFTGEVVAASGAAERALQAWW
ncbi:HAD-IIA family hydrolase [Corynebacterium liangguodongii]|uniref:HAD family hydrolase n=1 Tax=Corynebacterium liangguodongii TaxID=2079535 RepID=A0A2S0WE67_9CORY|nr:HAD-IIA family hydrolase [Corynebacterium liangguodongii]AWB83962.1 HAD family hydrolase [Corynebacterium liangguodongii]PWB99973.1 HAD-IIA family hydrolase [Corynebacterium liangguodongii]